MKVEELNKIIIGKWGLENGGNISFSTNEDFIFTDREGKTNPDKQKMFLTQQKDGTIKLTCPFLFEPLGLIKSFTINEIIYDSLDLDGARSEIKLTRI
jgi:hypothetical protein